MLEHKLWQIIEHVLWHIHEHVLRKVPARHALKHVLCYVLEHVPHDRLLEPPSLICEEQLGATSRSPCGDRGYTSLHSVTEICKNSHIKM